MAQRTANTKTIYNRARKNVTVPLSSVDVELHVFNAVLSFVSRQTK